LIGKRGSIEMSQDEEFEEIRQLEIDELNRLTSEGRAAHLRELARMQAPTSLIIRAIEYHFGRVPIIELRKRRHRRGYSRASGGICT